MSPLRPGTHPPPAFLLVMGGAVLTAIVFFPRCSSPGENSGERRSTLPSFQNSLVLLFHAPHAHHVPVTPGPAGGAWLMRTGWVAVFDSFYRAPERVPLFLGGHGKQTQGSAVTTIPRPA